MPRIELLTEVDYLARESSHQGLCSRCHAWACGVDPGAAGLQCRSCGTREVHGVEQALLLGLIGIQR